MTVKVYTTPTCPWCRKTKAFLEGEKVEFEEVDVSASQEAADEMEKISDQRGVPVTVIGDKFIIGFDEEALKSALDEASEELQKDAKLPLNI